MSRSSRLYLEDIYEACQRISTYSDQLTYEQYLADYKTRDAILRNIEIIGEAIKQLPDEVRQKAPHIEWRNIARMRDRVAHAYFSLSDKIVWDTIQNHVPVLSSAVAEILADIDEI